MIQHRFLIYAWTSCAAIAIGSVGPWASGYLGFMGASGVGILSLLGAGVAALTIWRWTITRSWVMLTFSQVASSLCLAVVIYAIYYDVYDPYVDAGDTWLQYIGWGLILTLLGASALIVLLLHQHRRSVIENWLKVGLLAGVVPAAVMGLWVVVAIASDNSGSETYSFPTASERAIPAHALKVTGGRVEGMAWGVWVFGLERENCLGTKTVEKELPGGERSIGDIEESFCGLDVPPRYWQQVVSGPIGSGEDHMSALVFLTRPDVARLDVLTGRDERSGQGPTWTSVKTNAIPKGQAREARLGANIGYAVAVVPDPACIRRVVVTNWMGNEVKRSPPFPCESSSSGFQLP